MTERNLTHQFRNLQLNKREEVTESDEMKISGYFVVFNSETELYDGMFEEISSEAFKNIDLSDVRALADHDTAKVLGRTKANTLKLEVDDKGLYGEILINKNDSEAVNLYERVKRKDIDQCSFGFNIINEEMEQRSDGSVKFTIKEIDLFEVSVVTFPAYQDTAVEARSKQIEEIKKRSIEQRKSKIREKFEWL